MTARPAPSFTAHVLVDLVLVVGMVVILLTLLGRIA